MQRESVGQSLLVATCLCIVCSVLVSSAAVLLKPQQEANKLRQMQKDVLSVAGLYRDGTPVSELFEQVETADCRSGDGRVRGSRLRGPGASTIRRSRRKIPS